MESAYRLPRFWQSKSAVGLAMEDASEDDGAKDASQKLEQVDVFEWYIEQAVDVFLQPAKNIDRQADRFHDTSRTQKPQKMEFWCNSNLLTEKSKESTDQQSNR